MGLLGDARLVHHPDQMIKGRTPHGVEAVKISERVGLLFAVGPGGSFRGWI
jgi:hypothetical protein